ncbi:substrate-binding periplasmic protein [Pseudomonas sp. NPDC090203]|uniref:substrate-binding periplasmic protein n=1 Tax=Pseudomonas sp. NPDC090203 TaxID=3364477 RepID=UPI0038208C4F
MKALFLVLGLIWLGSAGADPIEVVTEDSSYTYVEHGKVAGPATQVVEETLRQAGIDDYHLALYPWARAYSIATQKPNVLIYPMVRTPEREALFHWVGELATVSIFLYKFRNQPGIQVTNLDTAKAYTIGVVRDDSREHYLQSQGFKKLIVSADNDENFRLFTLHQVQLIPMPERDAKSFCQQKHIAFDQLEVAYPLHDMEKGIYMAYSLGTSEELVSRTTRAFSAVVENGELRKAMGH